MCECYSVCCCCGWFECIIKFRFWIVLVAILICFAGHEYRLYMEAQMKNKNHELKLADATQYAGGKQYLVTVAEKDGK